MRVLVIEDEIKIAQSLKKILENEKYVVDVSYDGENGYEQASVEEYDVILLDLNLPRMNGVRVCKNLRSDGIEAPIIMLTARDEIDDRILGLDAGADDYVVKPFDFDELLARIRAQMRRDSGSTEPVLKVGDLSLNPQSKLVVRGKTEIDLSAKEFALLEYLMRHPNQVISKSSLLDHVWGSEVDPLSNVVDVYIGYLRKKIDKRFTNRKPLLLTVKGMGYKISAS